MDVNQQTFRKLSNEYIRGLIEGEGCFTFCTTGELNHSGEKKKVPTFSISMHERDQELLEMLKYSLGIKNKVYNFRSSLADGYNRGRKTTLIVREIGNLKNIIVPIFYNRLAGHKGKQFNAWLETIGSDPLVSESYKIIYRLHKNGYYRKNPKFID